MKKNNQNGFSLIELLLVVVIIGIIAAIAVPSLLKAREIAQRGSTYSTMRTLATLQVKYFAQNNRFGRLNEINSEQESSLVTTGTNTFMRSGFTYTMNPSAPTDDQLRLGYTIVATKAGTGTLPPTIIEVSQSGQISGIIE